MTGSRLVALRLALVAVAVVSSSLSFVWSPAGASMGRLLAGREGIMARLPGSVLESSTPAQAAFLAAFVALSVCMAILRLLAPTKQSTALAVIVLVLNAPGLLAHSTLDWTRLVLDRPMLSPAPIPPATTTGLALAAAVAVLTNFLLARWQDDVQGLEASGVEPFDRATYLRNHLVIGSLMIGGSLVTTLAVLLLALVVSTGPRQAVDLVPWPIVLLGGGAAALILGTVFLTRPYFRPEPDRATKPT